MDWLRLIEALGALAAAVASVIAAINAWKAKKEVSGIKLILSQKQSQALEQHFHIDQTIRVAEPIGEGMGVDLTLRPRGSHQAPVATPQGHEPERASQ